MTWNKGLSPEERERRSKAWKQYAERLSDKKIPEGGDFYDTGRWSYLRNRTLIKYGQKCQKCGFGGDSFNPLQVDHIKPRSTHPELQWEISNLQVLCKSCNKEKSNKNESDWRRW